MLYETVGAATAAAGGLVLRLGIRSTATTTNTITAGDVSGSILNQGSIGRDATMTVGAPPTTAPAGPTPPAPAPKKPLSMAVVIGGVLIVLGIVIFGYGLYWDWMAAKSS